MDTFQIIQNGDEFLLRNYNRAKTVLMRGDGMYVYDSERGKYLDFFSGIAVNALGYSYPEIVEAIIAQVKKLGHVSNYYYNEPNVRLAKLLCEISFAQKVFFCNSGAEANEAAIKAVRKFFRRKGENRYEILSFHGSFHGRTYGALAATGQVKYHDGFEPLPFGFHYAHFNDLDSVRRAITPKTAAVIVEMVQGEGGILPASPEFVKGLREMTRERGIFLIVDEVQTGIARTGKMWAYEHFGIEPDLMTSAKALGGGLPLGALLMTNQLEESLQPGDHASTFGGNPICCSASIAAIETIILKNLAQHAAKQGDYLRSGLLKFKEQFPGLVTEVRGMGLMLALETTRPAADLMQRCAKQGLLVGPAGEKSLRLVPPLIVSQSDIDLALEKLGAVFSEVSKSN